MSVALIAQFCERGSVTVGLDNNYSVVSTPFVHGPRTKLNGVWSSETGSSPKLSVPSDRQCRTDVSRATEWKRRIKTISKRKLKACAPLGKRSLHSRWTFGSTLTETWQTSNYVTKGVLCWPWTWPSRHRHCRNPMRFPNPELGNITNINQIFQYSSSKSVCVLSHFWTQPIVWPELSTFISRIF